MAPRVARGALQAAQEPAVPLHRLVCVVGTGRVVATRRGKDLRERHLIAADHCQQDRRHEFNLESLSADWSTSSWRSAKASSYEAGRAIQPKSYIIQTPCDAESGLRSRSSPTTTGRRHYRHQW